MKSRRRIPHYFSSAKERIDVAAHRRNNLNTIGLPSVFNAIRHIRS